MKSAVIATMLASTGALNTVQQVKSVSELEVSANPIRKVVVMLQNMQKKVTAEG